MGGREEEERDGGKGGEEIRARQYFQSELLFSILNSPPAGCRYEKQIEAERERQRESARGRER